MMKPLRYFGISLSLAFSLAVCQGLLHMSAAQAHTAITHTGPTYPGVSSSGSPSKGGSSTGHTSNGTTSQGSVSGLQCAFGGKGGNAGTVVGPGTASPGANGSPYPGGCVPVGP